MPTLRRLRAVPSRAINPIQAFTWSIAGTDNALGASYPNEKAARRGWEQWRPALWARTRRGCVPSAAKYYDNLTDDARSAFMGEWGNFLGYRQSHVQDAIDVDRAAVEAFRKTNPKGARAIESYLLQFFDVLAEYEREARGLDGSTWDDRHQLVNPYHRPTAPYGGHDYAVLGAGR